MGPLCGRYINSNRTKVYRKNAEANVRCAGRCKFDYGRRIGCKLAFWTYWWPKNGRDGCNQRCFANARPTNKLSTPDYNPCIHKKGCVKIPFERRDTRFGNEDDTKKGTSPNRSNVMPTNVSSYAVVCTNDAELKRQVCQMQEACV